MGKKVTVTFKRNKRLNVVTLEVLHVRSDGAVQVRAVIPLEKARRHARTEKEAVRLAARAAVGLACDAAELAEGKLEAASAGMGWNPLRRARNVIRRAGNAAIHAPIDLATYGVREAAHLATEPLRYGAGKFRRGRKAPGAAQQAPGGGGDGGGGDEGGGAEDGGEADEGGGDAAQN